MDMEEGTGDGNLEKGFLFEESVIIFFVKPFAQDIAVHHIQGLRVRQVRHDDPRGQWHWLLLIFFFLFRLYKNTFSFIDFRIVVQKCLELGSVLDRALEFLPDYSSQFIHVSMWSHFLYSFLTHFCYSRS